MGKQWKQWQALFSWASESLQMVTAAEIKRCWLDKPRQCFKRQRYHFAEKGLHGQNYDNGIQSHHFMANRWGNNGKQWDFIFLGSKITADGDCSHEIKRCLLLGRKVMTKPDSTLKSRDITLPTNPSSQSYGFSSSHLWMWKLDYKESWVLKNLCFWTVVLHKTLESPDRKSVV